MQESVEHRRGDSLIGHELCPLRERPIRGHDDGAGFVAGVDELEEDMSLLGRQGLVTDLVDEQDIRLTEPGKRLPETILLPGADKALHGIAAAQVIG